MKLLNYREILGPANEYAWTIIFQYKNNEQITEQKDFLGKLINSKHLNKNFFKHSINYNSLIHNIWRPIPFNKLSTDDFEFITTTERLKEVFNSAAYDLDSSKNQSQKYNSKILNILLKHLHCSNGIWHISSNSFEDNLKNDFVTAGINTELFISIDTHNQTVTTIDYGSD